MPLNGTTLLDDPFNTIFSPFTELLGSGFWLIPLTFIAVALYMKTRNVTSVSVFLIASGILLATGNMFTGAYAPMGLVYLFITALGLVGVIVDIFFMKR